MTGLQEYVKSAKDQIKAALGDDAKLAGSVVLEISTTVDSKVGAGLNIQVVELGSQVSAQQTHKITIPIMLLTEAEKAKDAAALAESQTKLAMAKRMQKSIGGNQEGVESMVTRPRQG